MNKKRLYCPPIAKPLESQLQVQQSAYGITLATRPLENTAHYCSSEPKSSAAYGGPKKEPGRNPQQPPIRQSTQPQLSGLLPGRSSNVPESSYYGPRATISNFSHHKVRVSEFAHLSPASCLGRTSYHHKPLSCLSIKCWLITCN